MQGHLDYAFIPCTQMFQQFGLGLECNNFRIDGDEYNFGYLRDSNAIWNQRLDGKKVFKRGITTHETVGYIYSFDENNCVYILKDLLVIKASVGL